MKAKITERKFCAVAALLAAFALGSLSACAAKQGPLAANPDVPSHLLLAEQQKALAAQQAAAEARQKQKQKQQEEREEWSEDVQAQLSGWVPVPRAEYDEEGNLKRVAFGNLLVLQGGKSPPSILSRMIHYEGIKTRGNAKDGAGIALETRESSMKVTRDDTGTHVTRTDTVTYTPVIGNLPK